MAELWLVCEGEPSSVDVALLQRVFADVLAAEIVVEPACGSSPSTGGSILENRRGGKAAFVHDRDYRARADAEASLVDGRPGFFWRRHSIENYLLPPSIILQAFQNLRERFEHQRPGHLPPWITALPASPEEVTEALCECARRPSRGRGLPPGKLTASGIRFPPRQGGFRSATPPRRARSDPDVWREALCQEAERVRRAGLQTAECPSLEREAMIRLFDTAYAEVTASSYIEDMEFLIDFHGRDLLKAFQAWLASRRFVRYYKDLCRDLISAAVRQYGDNRAIYGKDDFRDLANGVRSVAGLAPLADEANDLRSPIPRT